MNGGQVAEPHLLKGFDPETRIFDWDKITAALMILLGHNSYHVAQLVMMQRLLGVWESGA